MGNNSNNTSTILIISGLSLSIIGLIAIEDDLGNWVEKLRTVTGLPWEPWNVVMVIVGLSMVGYGVWLNLRKRQPADGDTERFQEKDRIFRIVFAPILYCIAKYQQFWDWSMSDGEDTPIGILKRFISLGITLLLALVGLVFLFGTILWGVTQLEFYIKYGRFVDLL